MRGVVFKGNREAEIREFPDPIEAFRTFDGATTGKCVFVMD